MLIKIKDDRYLNADYIVVLSLSKPGLVDVKKMELPSVQTWKIIARMLDGSSQLLIEEKGEEDARREFDRLIRESNKRLKELKYEA